MSRSMIFAPDRGNLRRAFTAAVVLLTLVGCGPTKVVVKGNFPPPLMEPLPLNMGLWYGDDFANHEFFDEAKSKTESSWIVKTGEAQVQMWDTLLAGMFDNVVLMKGKPGPGQMNQVVDAVLIPLRDGLTAVAYQLETIAHPDLVHFDIGCAIVSSW